MEFTVFMTYVFIVNLASQVHSRTMLDDAKDGLKNELHVHNLNYTGESDNITREEGLIVYPGEPVEGKVATGGCALVPDTETLHRQIHLAVLSGVQLITFDLDVRAESKRIINPRAQQYKPYTWVVATNHQILGLLFLSPGYKVRSLYTLASDVTTIQLTVEEKPSQCLHQLSDSETEELIRDLVTKEFKDKSGYELSSIVCNMHILNISGTAVFQYRCCEEMVDLQTKCYYLTSKLPMTILFLVITVFKVIMALYSPKFIPDSMYRMANVAMIFLHKLEQPMKLRVLVKKKTDDRGQLKFKTKLRIEQIEGMPKFYSILRNLRYGTVYTFRVDQLSLLVSRNQLMQENQAPVGFMNVIYDSFVNCSIRNRKSVASCCESACCSIRCCKLSCRWYTCLRTLMHVLMVMLLLLPWLIRLHVYYNHEKPEYDQMEAEATIRHLDVDFPGNLTVYLKPNHPFFILIYCIIGIDILIYQLQNFSNQKYKDIMKFVIYKCFNDMREIDVAKDIGRIVRIVVFPCKRWGIIGFCLGVVFFPITCIIIVLYLGVYTMPSINIVLRLLVHIFRFVFPRCGQCKRFGRFCKVIDDTDRNLIEIESTMGYKKRYHNVNYLQHPCQRLLQLLIILICLSSLFAFIIIIFELLSFVVEIIVFTLIGVILNASKLLNYVSFVFLVFIYVNDCFGGVRQKFTSFSKSIIGHIVNLGNGAQQKLPENQLNTAIRINNQNDDTNETEAAVALTTDAHGQPYWKVKNLVLFQSSSGEQMIPKCLLFETCKLKIYNAPGDLLLNYIKALGEFTSILLFLMFVFLVVIAFGHAYEISATNQMLATAAGGIAPLLLKNFIFRSRTISNVETTSMTFQTKMTECITRFEQLWPIHDIGVEQEGISGRDCDNMEHQDARIERLCCSTENLDNPDIELLETHPEQSDNIPIDLLVVV